ncbi:MAG TPA: hypothetical protein VIH99_07475 [Bdellovibrionota bacterium]|jgi:hypothetical protein
MKKTLLALLIVCFAAPAFAAPAKMGAGEYRCSIFPTSGDEPGPIKLRFELDRKGEPKCQKMVDSENCGEWFLYSARNQDRFWLDGLYDGGVSYNDNGDWEVFADSDGCNIGKLVLYKDSDFTKGFITSEFRCSSTRPIKNAGKVYCEKQ